MTDIDPDAIESVEDLREVVDELAADLDRVDGNVNGLFARAGEFDERLAAIEDRLDALEDQVELVDATMPAQQKSKLAKVRDILQYGMTEATGGRGGVKVTTGEAAAAAGASRDTARRLMDEIGANFSWADVETPGGPNPKELRLAIRGRDLGELMDDVRGHYGGASA